MKEYLVELDKHDINVVESAISRSSVKEVLIKYLEYMDCSRTFPSGTRIIQTIGLPYKHLVSIYYYVLDKLDDEEDKTKYEQLLISRHNENLEYEKEHAPVVYKNPKKGKSLTTSTKDKEKKPTKKMLKQAEKLAKIGKLKINLK